LTTITTGWLQEAAAYGSNTLSSLNRFGLPLPGSNTVDLLLNTDIETYVTQLTTVLYGTPTAGNNPLKGWQAKYTPVNAIFLWHTLGKFTADGGGAGIDQIEIHAVGTNKPRISLYTAILDNAITTKKEAFGALTNSLRMDWSLGKPLTIVQAGLGQNHGVSTASPTAPALPTGAAHPYDYIYGVAWNAAAITNAYQLTAEITQPVIPYLDTVTNVGKYADINDQIPFKGTVQIYMMGATSVITSLITDKNAGTARTLTFSFKKAYAAENTHYITVTCANAICQAADIMATHGDRMECIALFEVSSIVCTKIDGVNDSYYTVS